MHFITRYFTGGNKSGSYTGKIFKKTIYSVLGILILFLFWFIISKIITSVQGESQFKGFSPLLALKAFISFFFNKFFWKSVLSSLGRIFIGLLISSIIGIPVGILIGFYKSLLEMSNCSKAGFIPVIFSMLSKTSIPEFDKSSTIITS